jgi:hypothetical protein
VIRNRSTAAPDRAICRAGRVAEFRQRAGGGLFETSLCAVGEHQPRDGAAITNWYLREPAAKPSCFACHVLFSPARRPAAFLTAIASRAPKAGTAVSAICETCWTGKSPDAIEAAALTCLRRHLNARSFAE